MTVVQQFPTVRHIFNNIQLIWWPVGDDIRTANQTTVPKVTEAVIYGLQFDVIYKLRVMGMNRGGDGKKSPTVYFTMLRGIWYFSKNPNVYKNGIPKTVHFPFRTNIGTPKTIIFSILANEKLMVLGDPTFLRCKITN